MIHAHCELFGLFFPHVHLPYINILQAMFWPGLHWAVPLEMCAAVESQGSECASPFSADLQPLSWSSHDGGTSVKDVKGTHHFKADQRF